MGGKVIPMNSIYTKIEKKMIKEYEYFTLYQVWGLLKR